MTQPQELPKKNYQHTVWKNRGLTAKKILGYQPTGVSEAVARKAFDKYERELRAKKNGS